jgi:thiamine-phosphate diphosphorylase
VIPRLHLVTDDEILAREEFLSQARHILEVGGREVALHLRGPGTSGRVIYALADALREPATRTGSPLIINDRLDIALVLGLAGVHLGQRSLPPRAARGLLGGHPLLGLSVHSAEEAQQGEGPGEKERDRLLDFLVVGSVFFTSSHPDRTPVGVEMIRKVQAVTATPILAIGGLTPGRIEEVRSAGAHGVAVRGGIWDAEDPTVASQVYLNELKS